MSKQIDIKKMMGIIELPMSALGFLNVSYDHAIAHLPKFRELLNKQRRLLSKKYHTDVHCGDEDKMKVINAAIDLLLTITIERPRPRPVVVFRMNVETGTVSGSTTTSNTYGWVFGG